MLILQRDAGESIDIFTTDGPVRVTLLDLHQNHARLGLTAPPEIKILRTELHGPQRPAGKPESQAPSP